MGVVIQNLLDFLDILSDPHQKYKANSMLLSTRIILIRTHSTKYTKEPVV